MKDTTKKRIQQKIIATYVPLRELIFEDNGREVNVVKDFTDYSPVLASVELIIYSFTKANQNIYDQDILNALKRIRRNPLQEFSRSEEDALAFAIQYGISRGLQQKRLAINEIHALLDWLIHEVEGRMQKNENYIEWLGEFFRDNPLKTFNGD
ncbi:hypothetical protein HZC30_06255 [Candidatus Woesearchaeota archaeon]|nr:hypothetical protein [Candidatus Woesearchaeota archaeon]